MNCDREKDGIQLNILGYSFGYQDFGNSCPDCECASSGKCAPLARLGSGLESNPTTKTALE